VLRHNPITFHGHYLFYIADDFSSVDVAGLKPWWYRFALATNTSAANAAKTPAVAANMNT
jgi:hypothetical protein